MRPPFPYVGGKAAIADRIVALLPAHRHYVETCAGSLAVLLAKPPSRAETVNDVDEELVTFWRVLRDQPDDLIRACTLTPHSTVEYRQAMNCPPPGSEVEQARRTWIRLTQGTHRTAGHSHEMWLKRISTGCHPDTLGRLTVRMVDAAERIAHVTLDQRPAAQMVEVWQRPDVLFYVDPPYPEVVPRYPLQMSDADHRDLLDALLATPAAVAVSGYPGGLYDQTLTGWNRTEIPSRARIPSGRSTPRTEILWTNRDPCTWEDEC